MKDKVVKGEFETDTGPGIFALQGRWRGSDPGSKRRR